MKRSAALFLTAVLLSGCQLPFFGPQPGPEGLKLLARSEQDTLQNLRGLPGDQLAALRTLTPGGYSEYGTPIDLADARFKLEVADFESGAEEKLKDVVFADYLTALSRAQAAGFDNVLPSLNLVDGLAKQINDGLYARLELIVERDRKAALRRRLFDAFEQMAEAHPEDQEWQALAGRLAASLSLAGEAPGVTGALKTAMDDQLARFDADALRSKPLGFYTLNDDLKRIFRADRMLQTKVELEAQGARVAPAVREASLAASVMAGNPALATAYDETARFYQRMTNPFSAYSPTALVPLKPAALSWEALATQGEARQAYFEAIKAARTPGMFLNFSVLPPSRSTETTLFATDPPPDDDLMGHLIRRIREGAISLAPQPDSGFYQYQQHALEALLTPDKNPESAKIAFGEKYLKRLEEAFKTGLTKARETHGKQLDVGPVATSAPPPPMKPRFFVEPVVTVYKRYGDMYAFLEKEVLPLFPAETLSGAKTLTETGEGERGLAEEVKGARRMMYGLYLVGQASLGLSPDPALPLGEAERAQALDEARQWLATYHQDPRMAADTRVSIPVGVSEPTPGQKFIHFWGTAGVTLVKVKAEYTQPPKNAFGQPEPATYFVAADKFVAFKRPYDKGVLDRAEYRRILDGSKTMAEAVRKLEGEF